MCPSINNQKSKEAPGARFRLLLYIYAEMDFFEGLLKCSAPVNGGFAGVQLIFCLRSPMGQA
ncbi:hypothetical protein SAMN05216375_10218 [Trichococcus ilyis]|uniref:Uncharacterized protein n=1 Tax=Trichococcus ilyis TaxID=640938 RepID=A0A143YGV2_9LACT|nr:Hypothetical protein TR210_542 [Trichococcus ilyis]SEI61942.1 hypothetical protein SAMN05216375_10218 [Trichococcus ilyis]